ncbi:MAG TPA: VOC family protein [Stellaceae bacterium]|jgi:uncharacterized glyoxalase superfamily protein PhnB|nr:VOC family protein [Stellaceae bacterium]
MQSQTETRVATMGVFIYLADVDGHYERARAAGAEMVRAPQDEEYRRTYRARDLDGHRSFFTTPPG